MRKLLFYVCLFSSIQLFNPYTVLGWEAEESTPTDDPLKTDDTEDLGLPPELESSEDGKLSENKTVKNLFEIALSRFPHLELDEQLCKGSQKWADQMAKTGRFRHDRGVKENIAKGYRNVESCMKGWFTSRGHNAQFRANKKVGFGFAVSKNGVRYWVSRFK